EHDPTLSVKTATDRINLATKDGDVTLAQALGNVPALALDPATVAGIKTEDDLKAAIGKVATGLQGALKFYTLKGGASLGATLKLNIKSLLVFGDDLPKGYDAAQMRERVF